MKTDDGVSVLLACWTVLCLESLLCERKWNALVLELSGNLLGPGTAVPDSELRLFPEPETCPRDCRTLLDKILKSWEVKCQFQLPSVSEVTSVTVKFLANWWTKFTGIASSRHHRNHLPSTKTFVRDTCYYQVAAVMWWGEHHSFKWKASMEVLVEGKWVLIKVQKLPRTIRMKIKLEYYVTRVRMKLIEHTVALDPPTLSYLLHPDLVQG